jgi:hypothetical protein
MKTERPARLDLAWPTASPVFDERSEKAAVDGSEREARFQNEVR